VSVSVIDYWDLKFICNLVLEIWNFIRKEYAQRAAKAGARQPPVVAWPIRESYRF
jgi:hypothetical protein